MSRRLRRLIIVQVACLIAIMFVETARAEEAVSSKRRVVKAFIVAGSPNSPSPSVVFDIGDVRISESLDVEILLTNTTNSELGFDQIHRACSCTKLSPEQGVIHPGGELKLELELAMDKIPQNQAGGGQLMFMNKGIPVFSGSILYRFPYYAGISDQMVVVGFAPKSTEEELKIPIVVGEHLKNNDVVVKVNGLDIDFEYEIDRKAGMLNATLVLKGDREFSRLYGELEVGDLASGRVRTTPLIIEREESFRVHPNTIRFVQSSEDGPYVSNIYVRGSTPAELCVVHVELGGQIFACTAKKLGTTVYKVAITAAKDQVESIDKSKSENKDAGPKTAKLTVTYGPATQKSDVRYYFQEFRE